MLLFAQRSGIMSMKHHVEETLTKVAIVMGSQSDWQQMKPCADLLDELGITYTRQVVSAHRMPDEMFAFSESAATKGYEVMIAGAGGAAHLPGMIASKTFLPVIGVPIKSSALSGMDSLLSIVQMPGGVPVATMAIGEAGAKNAALFAARILAGHNPNILTQLEAFQQAQRQQAIDSNEVFQS